MTRFLRRIAYELHWQRWFWRGPNIYRMFLDGYDKETKRIIHDRYDETEPMFEGTYPHRKARRGIEAMMHFFGGPHPLLPSIETPVGSRCTYCEESIIETDLGYVQPASGDEPAHVFHGECFLRTILGSVGHVMKLCKCYGGDRGDPEGMTKRQAALTAVEVYRMRRDLEEELQEELEPKPQAPPE